jgi:glutamine synthetase
MTPKEALAFARARDARAVELAFCDLFGTVHRILLPAERLSESLFRDGVRWVGLTTGCELPSTAGLLVLPDPASLIADPLTEASTVTMVCDGLDPRTRQPSPLDPRGVARRAEAHLLQSGVADQAGFAIRALCYLNDTSSGGADASVAADRLADLRTEMMLTMVDCGIDVTQQFAVAGTRGQCGFDLGERSIVAQADCLLRAKHAVRRLAANAGLAATFMAKPLFDEPGSGLSIHVTLRRSGKSQPVGLPQSSAVANHGGHWIGGLIRHAPALLALCAPTTNSYRRLSDPDAPTYLRCSASDRTACCGPAEPSNLDSGSQPVAGGLFRLADPTCNPYLAFAAILMAGLDGIRNGIAPTDHAGQSLPEAAPAPCTASAARQTPRSLDAAVDALDADRSFLCEGGVFSAELLDAHARRKREEARALRQRPHPHETTMYFDA